MFSTLAKATADIGDLTIMRCDCYTRALWNKARIRTSIWDVSNVRLSSLILGEVTGHRLHLLTTTI